MKKQILLLFLSLCIFQVYLAQPVIQWQKSFGGTAIDQGYSIQQTFDGGYVAAGTSQSNDFDVTGNHGLGDYWIVKVDSAGTIQWQKSFGGTGEEVANSILQTSKWAA